MKNRILLTASTALVLSAIFFGMVERRATADRRSTVPEPPSPVQVNLSSDNFPKTPLNAPDDSEPSAIQTDYFTTGQVGNQAFGTAVTVLPNGNIVVTDPYYDLLDPVTIADVGAVYLISGSNGKIIGFLSGSTANDFVGSSSITIVGESNYVVNNPFWDNGSTRDAGSVTFQNGEGGSFEAVSASNSLVGTTADELVGLGGVTALTNGNYVVNSYFWSNGGATGSGAVTWANGSTGITGPVSASNSLVGTTALDRVGYGGVTALTNGNYVISSALWSNGAATNAGAVTWVNGSTGITGPVSASNSLVGTTANDQVGYGGVTALTNGNYVVRSVYWNNGAATNAGAATWASGSTGITGPVSASNSLVGTTANDLVGTEQVTELTNGNYVVSSPEWNNGAATRAGAVTWVNGSTGITGPVSASNSLVGTTANDLVGTGTGSVTALTNGNYVVRSSSWSNGPATDAGAATWGNGSTGIIGPVSATNSLVGTTANDRVGFRVTALTNGNYVVSSPGWNNGAATDAGAATWGNGLTGITGPVSASNSLVGTTALDRVGNVGVTALTNGNYVVSSPNWANGSATNAGAATWGNGSTGITGPVSASNSLVGSSWDYFVGSGGVTALTNGNYVVWSPKWLEQLGALTWGNGITGITGLVSTSNSLLGTTDSTTYNERVIPLPNGNYVFNCPSFDSATASDVGAVTWGIGTRATTGSLSATNSLIGTSTGDLIGSSGVIALPNGNYVVSSPGWDNGSAINAGAVTWGSGTSGVVGQISATNSLVGTTAGDQIGGDRFDVTALPNGNYVVKSLDWDNGAVINAGAITYGAGNGGTVGPITANNSVRGVTANGGGSIKAVFDPLSERLFVGQPQSNRFSTFQPVFRSVSDGSWLSSSTWNYGNFTKPQKMWVRDFDVTIDSAASALSLNIASTGSVAVSGSHTFAGSILNNGTFDLSAGRTELIFGSSYSGSCTALITGTGEGHYLFGGEVRREVCSNGTFRLPVGTENGYSPVDVDVTSVGTAEEKAIAVTEVVPSAPSALDPASSLKRRWSMFASEGLAANVTFNYRDPIDIAGNESGYRLFSIGDTALEVPGFILDVAQNRITGNQIANFGTFGVGQCVGVAIGPSSLPNAVRNTQYQQTLTASGGSGPYTFVISSGALPTGLSLSSAGVISGTPTAAGNFAFTVTATYPGGCPASRSYDLTVDDPTPTGPAIRADYRFQGNLNNEVAGGPVLTELVGSGGPTSFVTENVDGYSRQTLRFPFNSGVAVNSLGFPNASATLVMLFKFDQVSGRRRLLDFTGGTAADNGAFMLDGRLDGESTANTASLANTYVQVVLVRTGTGSLRIYRDGFLRLETPDGGSPLAAGIRFFQDVINNPIQASPGNLARLRLYEGAMTPEQVQALDRVPEAPFGEMPILLFTSRNGTFELYRMNADGTSHRRLTSNMGSDIAGKFSPDGKKIVYQRRDVPTDPYQIWIANADGSGQLRLTNTEASNQSASWRPDGQKILFSSCSAGRCDLFTMNPDGTGSLPIAPANTIGDEDEATYTPDGQKLVFKCSDIGGSNYQICVSNADGTGRQAITNTAAPLINQQVDVSPDGQKIAFVRNSTTVAGIAGFDIYTANIDGSNVVNITNNATSDQNPTWSPDGTKIMFTAARAGGINDIWLMNANGSGAVRLMQNSFDDRVTDWFPGIAQTTAPFDFDGDGKTDVSVFRPTPGEWWYLRSSDGGNGAATFGASTDTIVPADYTGDGKTDMAFFRPVTGEWYVLRSNDFTFYAFPFGSGTDTPVPADFDGDNKADPAVFRPATSEWYVLRSSDGGVSISTFGTIGDRPVPADYDGDGKADVAVFRPNGGSGGGEWWYLRSSDGANRAFSFATSTDLTVPGDYTGDGKADIAYFRPATGEWFVLRSEDGSFYAFPWGAAGDVPSPGDYDGDGKIDAAVFRDSNTTWYVNGSTAGTIITAFGLPGDRPVPNAYVR